MGYESVQTNYSGIKGDTFGPFSFVYTRDDSGFNLTGTTLRSHMKDTVSAATISLDLATYWTMDVDPDSDGSNHKAKFTLQIGHLITETKEAKTYFYDLELTFPDGTRRTIIHGNLSLTQDTTFT